METRPRDIRSSFTTSKAMDKVNKGFAFSKYYNAKIRGHLTKLIGDQFKHRQKKPLYKTAGELLWLAATKDYRVDSISRFKMD